MLPAELEEGPSHSKRLQQQTNNHSQDPKNEKNNAHSALINLPSELAEINEISAVVNSGNNEDYENRLNGSES